MTPQALSIPVCKDPHFAVTAEVELEAQIVTLRMSGLINESSDLQKVSDYLFKLEPKARVLRFDLAGITDINSSGLRQWVIFIRRVENIGPRQQRDFEIVFSSLGEVFLERANTFLDMLGAKPRVEAIEVPYRCASCQDRSTVTMQVKDLGASASELRLPEPSCGKCGSAMEFDEDLSGYFRFLKRISR
ncbi:MAG: hypothetical protein NDJ89_04175 [Oligoflexia bacterium]|nr:hypothetical protein [Oligoflexia bacterium]